MSLLKIEMSTVKLNLIEILKKTKMSCTTHHAGTQLVLHVQFSC